jgi:outer membrane immunogenic protein
MKAWLVAFIASGTIVGPSLAADLALYDRPPVITWTGAHIGANGGWVESSGNTITNIGTDTGPGGLGSEIALGHIPGSTAVVRGGFIGGGQIGYDWQFGAAWVAGLEADFDGASAKHTSVSPLAGTAAIVPMSSVFSRELHTLGTVRGRLGFLSSPDLLWYGTGGLAYGQTKFGSAWICPACIPPAGSQGSTALQISSASAGWTLGAGVEWKFAPAWSVKAEYLYVDLGNQRNTLAYSYTGFNSTMTSTVAEHDNIARFGLNYKFF